MQRLFDLFEELNLPYYRQGSLSDKDYKPSFFTFWNVDAPNTKHRDNKVKAFSPYYQVGFYTNNADFIYTKKENGQIIFLSPIDDLCERASKNGFIVVGKPKDANADQKGYAGRVCYLRTIEKTED